ncbi:MAG: DUF4381 domain-containing protein [Xanthomonadales bacterium]|nr:DUF4381 domain-containing protein [Xanthomonadales bacterium]
MQSSTPDPANALAEVLKERLQDIHAVAEPSWWPPAPGWWVLAAIALAAVVLGGVRLYRHLKVQLRRRRLLRELEQLEATFNPITRPADYLSAVNRLFRAIALRAFPGTGCARLEGQAWVAFIRSRLPHISNPDALLALETGPYQPEPSFDLATLQDCARRWVRHYG